MTARSPRRRITNLAIVVVLGIALGVGGYVAFQVLSAPGPRRLAYVAWTRARRSLTLVYDPGAPSQFLREAFSNEEIGVG